MKLSKTNYILFTTIIMTLLLVSAYLYTSNTAKADIKDLELSSNSQNKDESVDERTSEIELLKIGAVSYPPYYYFEDGEFRGEFAEIAIEAFNRMDINYEIKEYPWSRMLEMLKIGDLDVLIDVYITEERLEYLDFSVEKYISYNEAFFKLVESDIDFNGEFSKLSGYKIGAVDGFYYGDSFEKAVSDGILNVEIVSSLDQSVLKLINQRIDLMVSPEVIGEKVIGELGYSNVVESIEPYVSSADSHFAFSKVNDLKKIRDDLDEIIRGMYEDGTIDEFGNK